MPSNCSNCGAAFGVEPEESAWIVEHRGDTPTMCPRCRALRDGLQDETITCTSCGRVFIFPRELRWYARLFSWPRPKRCIGGCRAMVVTLTETEKLMADFLKRLRAANKLHMMSSGSGTGPGNISRRFRMTGSANERTSSGTTPTAADTAAQGMGGSLAQALKEFQERKRKKG